MLAPTNTPVSDAIRFNRTLAKARVIAGNGKSIHMTNDVYHVPSSTYEGEFYTTTPRVCNCMAFQSLPIHYRGAPACKHTLAIRILKGEKILAMPETTTPATQADARTQTLNALNAMAAGMESLNERTSNIEEKFDALLNLVSAGLAEIAKVAEKLQLSEPGDAGENFHIPAQAYQAVYDQMNKPPLGPNQVIVTTATICKGWDAARGRPLITVQCGQWNKYGVPIYPEYLSKLGFADANAVPEGSTPWNYDVVVELRDNGQPKKIVGFAP
jgi:hypothetical protein